MATNDRARQYVRPVVVPCDRAGKVRPYVVRHDGLHWQPLTNGRKRARLPRAV